VATHPIELIILIAVLQNNEIHDWMFRDSEKRFFRTNRVYKLYQQAAKIRISGRHDDMKKQAFRSLCDLSRKPARPTQPLCSISPILTLMLFGGVISARIAAEAYCSARFVRPLHRYLAGYRVDVLGSKVCRARQSELAASHALDNLFGRSSFTTSGKNR